MVPYTDVLHYLGAGRNVGLCRDLFEMIPVCQSHTVTLVSNTEESQVTRKVVPFIYVPYPFVYLTLDPSYTSPFTNPSTCLIKSNVSLEKLDLKNQLHD